MRRITSFLLIFVLAATLLAAQANAAVYQGKALDEDYIRAEGTEGEIATNYQIQYWLDTDTGVMRIYCHPDRNPQKMLQYSFADWIPWYRDAVQRNAIKTVYIEEGVQTVGHYSFLDCRNLEEVWLPTSVWRVDRRTFSNCQNLRVIHFPGTKEDLDNSVIWIDDHNYYQEKGTENIITAKSLIQFGEHVRVTLKNDEGDVIKSYTVRGYAAGEAYTVTPPELDHLTLLSDATPINGTFLENDQTEYTYTYHCDHQYETDPEKPCAAACIYCNKPDPDAVPHTYEENVITKRGLFTEYRADVVCSVCGEHHEVTKPALIVPIAIYGGSGLGVLVVLLIAINVHAAHKRKRQNPQATRAKKEKKNVKRPRLY